MTESYYQPLINPKFVQEYGAMPTDMLVAKFDMTMTGDDDDNDEMSHNFMISQCVDYGPDAPLFEYEEARRTTNRKDVLDMRDHGNRGMDANMVYRPEIFLDNGGEGDHDRQQVDPDMRKLVNENAARHRYVNFGKDMSDFEIDGNRAPAQEIADRQRLLKDSKERLTIFSQQYDGRRNGQYRSFQHASNVRKQRGEDAQVATNRRYKDYAIEGGNNEDAYTDDRLALNEYIAGDINNTTGGRYNDQLMDAALTPQNSRSYKVGQELGPSSLSRSTVDGEFEVQSYSHVKHHKTVHNGGQSHSGGSTTDGHMEDGSDMQFHAQLRVLKQSAKNLVKLKSQLMVSAKNGDVTMDEFTEIDRNITSRLVRNGEAMNEIAKYVITSGEFHDDTGYDGSNRKGVQHSVDGSNNNLRTVSGDAERNAEYVKFQIRKLSKQGNLAGMNKMTVAHVDTDEFFTAHRSSGRKKVKVRTGTGSKAEGERSDEFKIAKIGANARVKKGSKAHLQYQRNGETFGSKEDETQYRKTGKAKMDNGETARESHNTQKLKENSSITRHVGKLGNKYMVKFQERDGKLGEDWDDKS